MQSSNIYDISRNSRIGDRPLLGPTLKVFGKSAISVADRTVVVDSVLSGRRTWKRGKALDRVTLNKILGKALGGESRAILMDRRIADPTSNSTRPHPSNFWYGTRSCVTQTANFSFADSKPDVHNDFKVWVHPVVLHHELIRKAFVATSSSCDFLIESNEFENEEMGVDQAINPSASP